MVLFTKTRKEASNIPSEKQDPAPSYDEAVRSSSRSAPQEQTGTLIDPSQMDDAEQAEEHEEIVTHLRVHAFTDPRVLLVDTSFTWEIDDYEAATHGVNVGEFVRSPPHIVDGFSWTIRLYPINRETQEHLSIYVDVEPVKKRKLGWKVSAEYGVVAWNPQLPQENESGMAADRCFEYPNVAWGWKKFCEREALTKPVGTHKVPLLHDGALNITAYVRMYKV